ncbi:MAG TPA: hypothetical protein VGD42_13045 [Lysobacter sp.]
MRHGARYTVLVNVRVRDQPDHRRMADRHAGARFVQRATQRVVALHRHADERPSGVLRDDGDAIARIRALDRCAPITACAAACRRGA